MASYDANIAGYTVTINYLLGGTNQVGVKKPSKVKSWATCPVSGKQIAQASNSVGEATRAVERDLINSITEANSQTEAVAV
jgi:hypothetical protein